MIPHYLSMTCPQSWVVWKDLALFSGQGSSCVTLVVPLLFPKMVVPQNHPKLVIICYYQWENQWFEVPILSETSI